MVVKNPKYMLRVKLPARTRHLLALMVSEDVLRSRNSTDWQASAIATINGQRTADYLSQFAAVNAVGGLEPHADWNQLMSSSALYIQDYYSIFEGLGTFYPGETMTLTFENGTQHDPKPWLAYYNSPGPTGPLSTGGDFYNFFVTGLYPASFDPIADPCNTNFEGATSSVPSGASPPTAEPTPTSWPNTAYPDHPDIHQPDLYPNGGGFLTGYFFKDTSTAVLSIPTFQMYGDDIKGFSDTVGNFIQRSKVEGLTKIVIDLQQNLGGDTLLAVDTFRHVKSSSVAMVDLSLSRFQFFPSIDPFRGSRLRAHPTADVLGNTFTAYYKTLSTHDASYKFISASDWTATDRINADTGENFTSWGEFYGPHMYNGDSFTTTVRGPLPVVVDLLDWLLTVDYFSNVRTYPVPSSTTWPWVWMCSATPIALQRLLKHTAPTTLF